MRRVRRSVESKPYTNHTAHLLSQLALPPLCARRLLTPLSTGRFYMGLGGSFYPFPPRRERCERVC